MECPVCVEKYSKLRKQIHCSCGFDVCIVCAERYILERAELPHCMSCENRWTKQFLYDNFNSSFVNGDYRKARKNILLDNELAKLPSTQEYLEIDNAFEYIEKYFILVWDEKVIEKAKKKAERAAKRVEADKKDAEKKAKLSGLYQPIHAYELEKKFKNRRKYVTSKEKIVTKLRTKADVIKSEIGYYIDDLDTEHRVNLKKEIVHRLIAIYRCLYNSSKSDDDIKKLFITNGDYHPSCWIKHYINRYRYLWSEFKNGIRFVENMDDPEIVGNTGNASNVVKKSPRKKFIHKCPDETCKGFLSIAYKCGLCKKFTCSKCFELKGDTKNSDHTCDENDVKTVELIKAETKPCPNCNLRISKIFGCSQMWCTSCNTAFNWNTGLIYKSVTHFHNPHYTEWVNRNPNDINMGAVDAIINCGELPAIRVIYNKYNVAINSAPTSCGMSSALRKRELLGDIHSTAHIIDVSLRKLIRKTITREDKNTDLRMRYLRDEITKEHLAKVAMMRDNVLEKNIAMIHILEIFTDTMTNQYNNILQTLNKDIIKAVDTLIDTATKIRDYCNEQLLNISRNYKMIAYQITDNFSTKGNHHIMYNVSPPMKKRTKTI